MREVDGVESVGRGSNLYMVIAIEQDSHRVSACYSKLYFNSCCL